MKQVTPIWIETFFEVSLFIGNKLENFPEYNDDDMDAVCNTETLQGRAGTIELATKWTDEFVSTESEEGSYYDDLFEFLNNKNHEQTIS